MSTFLNRQITADELDFETIKASLKDFLRGQSNFSDYEFEGSAISVLLDILAYNTYYNALYTNFAINEMFIDSASKLSSVTSLAKSIGYTPKSALASVAKITVTVSGVPGNPSTLTMPKNTLFRSEVNGTDYVFLTHSTYSTVRNVDNTYTFSDVEIIQGEYLTQSYIASPSSTIVIPNDMVDMTRVCVKVYENANTSAFSVFNLATDVLTITGTDKVYFVKKREDLFYELFFGNNVIGASVDSGNRIVIEYYKTKGSSPNGCNIFFYAGGFAGEYQYNVVTVSAATDGAEPETRDSIKYNAPRYYKSQHRAVTAGDYEAILREHNPLIETIKVWGGEDNVPPVFGKVFISAKPTARSRFTSAEKEAMISWLRNNRAVLSILPEFVDASLLNVEITSSVIYNPARSDQSESQIKANVMAAISDYADTLNDFNTNFYHSELSGIINSANRAIVSNTTKIRIRTTITPNPGVSYKYEYSLGNRIDDNGKGGNVLSTRFMSNEFTDRVYFKDDSTGVIWLYSEDEFGIATKQYAIGDVDYQSGVVTFTTNFRDYFDSEFELVIEPASFDIIGVNNFIVSIPSELTSVSVVTTNSNIVTDIR